MSKKSIVIAGIVLLVAIVAILLLWKFMGAKNETALEDFNNEISNISTTTKDNIADLISEDNSTSKNTLKERAWSVLEKYLEFAKNHDIKSLSALSYQISAVCKDEKQKDECFNRMDTVYFLGNSLKKEDFKYEWSDAKQIILATDFFEEENDKMISKSRGMIYFVIEAGQIKLLSFNNAKGAVVQKGEASKSELENRLKIYTEDKDEDGKEDYLEQCLSTSQDESCTKTDPKKKDSDGNGLWDGIEALIVK